MIREQEIRKKLKRTILLNPGPATTSVRVKSALLVDDICPRERDFGTLLAKVRKDAVAIVKGEATHTAILLTSSGTGAMEAVISSAIPGGTAALVLENGAYGRRMKEICGAFGIPVVSVDSAWGDPIDLERVRTAIKSSAQKISTLVFIHHETTVGILNPLPELHAIAREFSLATVVDAMSSYAGLPIDLSATPVDYLISSSNKCIQGMAGIGIVVAKKTSLEALKTSPAKNYYFNLYKNFEAQEKRGESLFTPPAQILYCLSEAFEEFKAEGAANRYARYRRLYERMYRGMRELGFKPLVNEAHHARILTAFIEPDGFDFNAYHDFLFARGITVYPGKGAKGKTFRISNLGDLTEQDIDYFLKATREFQEA